MPALALIVAGRLVLRHTALGLAMHAAGVEPRAVDKSGLSVTRVRYGAVLFTGVMSALGGLLPVDRRHPHLHRRHDQRRRLPGDRRR